MGAESRNVLVIACLAMFGGMLLPRVAVCQWERVLDQVALPHHYYYREMYLPQMSGGPDSADWTADGESVVLSEDGYLWLQSLAGGPAVQLTDSEAYDYQPDVAADGRRVVFVREYPHALELQLLDLESGSVTALTGEGAVNVEPRWSPDGSRLAFVSTRDNGRFQAFVGTLEGANLEARRLRTERRSRVPRYYYSEYDHELSPTWSPDGSELIFVTNPEAGQGTGGLWRAALAGGGALKPVQIEETSWQARPDWNPDGRRIVYSSYLGRQWHQLWMTSASGGDPIALTYGEFDATGARWSPDGSRILYLSNESGTRRLWVMDLRRGGERREIPVDTRTYLRPHGTLVLDLRNAAGRGSPARVAVRDAAGRYFFAEGSRPRAVDGYDRGNSPATWRYFHADGSARLELPAGNYEIIVWHGLEQGIARGSASVQPGQEARLSLKAPSLALPVDWREWSSADLHVHMNYGGTYRNTPARLVQQAAAEDLDLVYNLVVNKEQRIPDIAYFTTRPDAASTRDVLLLHGQEFHTSLWGHLGLLGLDDHFLIPDYAAYPTTAAASPAPGNGAIADLAHAQHGLVGYVHPFDTLPDPTDPAPLSNSLPVDAALGRVDYYEVVGFSDHLASAEVWHRLLNCGFRIAAGAGTDAMANYASLRGPVGLNRVYARLGATGRDDAARRRAWLAALASGHTFATNGPLLEFELEGRGPGEELDVHGGAGKLHYRGMMRSIVPVERLEIIADGKSVASIPLDGGGTAADFSGKLDGSGVHWVLLRAWSSRNAAEIFDLYPYASTTPVWLAGSDAAPTASCDTGYFLAWLDRIEQVVESSVDYNGAAEKEGLLRDIAAARAAYERLAQ